MGQALAEVAVVEAEEEEEQTQWQLVEKVGAGQWCSLTAG